MTREELYIFGAVLLTTAVAAFVLHIGWFVAAWWAQRETKALAKNQPERIVADGDLLQRILMQILAAVLTITGVLVGLAILSGTFSLLGPAGYLLAFLMLAPPILTLLMSWAAWLNLRKLNAEMRKVREVCAITVYEDCPLTTTARRQMLMLRDKAAQTEEKAAQIEEQAAEVKEAAKEIKEAATEITEGFDDA